MTWLQELQFEAGTIPTVVIFGGILFLLFGFVVVSRGGSARTSRWWLGVMGGSLILLAARIVHRATPDPHVAAVAVRVQFAIGIAFAPLALGAIESLLGYPRPSRAFQAIAAATAAMVVVVVATSWVIGDAATLRHDAFGSAFWAIDRQRLVVLAVFILLVAPPILLRLRQLPRVHRRLRTTIRIAAAACALTGVNDTLLSAGVITSVHLFEFAFAFVAIASMTYLQRRVDDTQGDLRKLVDEATNEIQASEQRYRDLADATAEGVLVLEGEMVADANAAFHALCGTTAAVIGRPALDVLAERTAPDRREAIAALLAGTRRDAVEIAVAAHTLELRVHAPGGLRAILVRDVSEQRELQRQLLRADRFAAMGTLAAGASHEINNPLTFVLVNAQLLRDMLGPDEPPLDVALAHELLGDIADGAQRIQAIVRDLMALATERNDETMAVDVRRVLDNSLAIARNQIHYRAQIIRNFADDVPLVLGNEVRLGQVFLHLLVNAADAIPEDDATSHAIEITVARGPDDTVLASVRDTGVGMPAHVRDRIFDPFYTTKEVGRGTGLGLSVSLGIVQALGGAIEVASAPGAGSTFTVKLRAAPTPTPAA